jgi:hypothetical protein
VARDLHSNLLGDTRSRQVSRSTASQVVDQKAVEAGFFACGAPCFPKIADLFSILMKNVGTVEPAGFCSLLDNFPQPTGQGQHPRLAVFRVSTFSLAVRPCMSISCIRGYVRAIFSSRRSKETRLPVEEQWANAGVDGRSRHAPTKPCRTLSPSSMLNFGRRDNLPASTAIENIRHSVAHSRLTVAIEAPCSRLLS